MANLNIAQLPVLSGLPSDDARFIVQQGSGTFQVTGEQLRAAYGGASGGSGGVQSVQAGSGIAVDDTDPENPVVGTLLEAGTNVTIVAGSAPNSLRISASGGGGGGGGPQQVSQIAKVGASPQLVIGEEISGSANTPLIVTNAAALNFDLTDLVGFYVAYFVAYAACTIGTPTGAKIIDKSGSAVATIACAQFETIQFLLAGDGSSNFSIQVLNRY